MLNSQKLVYSPILSLYWNLLSAQIALKVLSSHFKKSMGPYL